MVVVSDLATISGQADLGRALALHPFVSREHLDDTNALTACTPKTTANRIGRAVPVAMPRLDCLHVKTSMPSHPHPCVVVC